MGGDDAFPTGHATDFSVVRLALGLTFLPHGLLSWDSTDTSIAIKRGGYTSDLGGLEIFQGCCWPMRQGIRRQNPDLFGLLPNVALTQFRALAIAAQAPAPKASVLAAAEQPLVTRLRAIEVGGKELETVDRA